MKGLAVEGLASGYVVEPVLRGFSMRAVDGEVLAILGPNGAGKTTLLKTLCGLVETRAGSVTLDGTDVTGWLPEDRARAGLLLVPEGRRLFTGVSVEDNLKAGRFTGRQGLSAEEVVELFPNLGERMQTRAGSLSGGEQQMLAIGRALVGDPRVLLIDEPSLGLAPLLVERVFSVFGTLASQGRAVVVSEQNVVVATEVADRCLVVNQGAIVFEGHSRTAEERDKVQRVCADMLEMGAPA